MKACESISPFYPVKVRADHESLNGKTFGNKMVAPEIPSSYPKICQYFSDMYFMCYFFCSCVCTCLCVLVEVWGWHWVSFLIAYLVVWDTDSQWTWSFPARLDCWPVNSLPLSLQHWDCKQYLAFHVFSGDLNLGPSVCTVIILASERSPQALHLTLMPWFQHLKQNNYYLCVMFLDFNRILFTWTLCKFSNVTQIS